VYQFGIGIIYTIYDSITVRASTILNHPTSSLKIANKKKYNSLKTYKFDSLFVYLSISNLYYYVDTYAFNNEMFPILWTTVLVSQSTNDNEKLLKKIFRDHFRH